MLPVPTSTTAPCPSVHKGFRCERSYKHNWKSGKGAIHRFEQMRWTSTGRDHVTKDYYPPKKPPTPKVKAIEEPERYTEADYATWLRL